MEVLVEGYEGFFFPVQFEMLIISLGHISPLRLASERKNNRC